MKATNRAPGPPPASAPQVLVKKPKLKTISFEDFDPDRNLSEVHRAAQFLDWAARVAPKRFVPYVWLAKHAYIKPRLPKPSDPDVETIRKRKMDQIKRILWETYKRRTVPSPRDQEAGVRATSDHEDLAGTDLLRNSRRLANSAKRLAETHAAIDPTQIRDQGLRILVQGMSPVVAQLKNPDLLRKLELPPKKEEPKPKDPKSE